MPFDATPATDAIAEATSGFAPAPTRAPWRTLLLSAADEMERRGGCKGDLVNSHGQVCFLGALSASAYGDPRAIYHSPQHYHPTSPLMQAVSAMARHLGVPRPIDYAACEYQMHHAAMWNNYHAHTPEHIILIMRLVATHGEPWAIPSDRHSPRSPSGYSAPWDGKKRTSPEWRTRA